MTAIEHREYMLYCDGDHGRAMVLFPDYGYATVARAVLRRQAVKAGWTHVRSPLGRKYDQDYCPQHKPEAE